MKKILRIGLLVLGGLLVLVAVGAAFIYFRGVPYYSVQKIEFKVTPTPEKVEKGLKLVTTLCGMCHLNRETNSMTGNLMTDAPPQFGKIVSANITQHPELGIGKWTDEQIAYLLRTGVKPDGRFLPPYMPKLVHASDEDIEAVIAFLRSDHPLVRPKAVKAPPCEPSFLTKFLSHISPAWQPFEYPKKPMKAPDTTNVLAHGEYLVNFYDCFTCHSASFEEMNIKQPRKSKGYLGGGNKVYDLKGNLLVTSNLTPDKETGIGNWSEETFINTLRSGRKPSGGMVKYPMIPYSRLTLGEAKAIYAYLKTVPPIKNKVQ